MKISQRKLSRIHTIDRIRVARACIVREENFHEWAQICEIRKSFPPRKFPAIRYPSRGIVMYYILYVTPGPSQLESGQTESMIMALLTSRYLSEQCMHDIFGIIPRLSVCGTFLLYT